MHWNKEEVKHVLNPQAKKKTRDVRIEAGRMYRGARLSGLFWVRLQQPTDRVCGLN